MKFLCLFFTLMNLLADNVSSMELEGEPHKGRPASQAFTEEGPQRPKKRVRAEQTLDSDDNSGAENVESKDEKQPSSSENGMATAEAGDTKSLIAKYIAEVKTETELSSHRREMEEFLGAINKLSPFMATILYKPLAEMRKHLAVTTEVYQSRQFNPFSPEATTASGHHIPVEVLVKIAGMLDSKDLCSLSCVSPFAYGIALESNSYYHEARKSSAFNSVIELQKALKEDHPEALAAVGITRHKVLQRRTIIELESLIQNFIKDCLQEDTFCGIPIDNYKQSQDCPKWFDIVESYGRSLKEANGQLKINSYNKWLEQALNKGSKQAYLYVLQNRFLCLPAPVSFCRPICYLEAQDQSQNIREWQKSWRNLRHINLKYFMEWELEPSNLMHEVYKLCCQFEELFGASLTPAEQDQALSVFIRAIELIKRDHFSASDEERTEWCATKRPELREHFENSEKQFAQEREEIITRLVKLVAQYAQDNWRACFYLGSLYFNGIEVRDNISASPYPLFGDRKQAHDYFDRVNRLIKEGADPLEKSKACLFYAWARLITDAKNKQNSSLSAVVDPIEKIIAASLYEWNQADQHNNLRDSVERLFEAFLKSPFGWVHPLMQPGSPYLNLYYSLCQPFEHQVIRADSPCTIDAATRSRVITLIAKKYLKIRYQSEEALPSLRKILDPLTFIIGTEELTQNYYYLEAFNTFRSVHPQKYEAIYHELLATLNGQAGKSLELIENIQTRAQGFEANYYEQFFEKAQSYLDALSQGQ